MKKKLLTLLLTLTGFCLYAQTSGGPDLYGYVWRNSSDPNGPVYNWVDIAALPNTNEVSGLDDDNFVGPYFLPNPFPYYWYTVDRFWIGSNGYISFAPTQFAHPFPAIPFSDSKNNFLAAMMTDLNLSTAGTAAGNPGKVYVYSNTAGDSTIITWQDVPFWAPGTPSYNGNNTFQIILSYVDSSITFQYQEQTGASASTTDFCSVGIENNSGAIGLGVLQNLYPTSQSAIKYYAPSTTTLQINDASTQFCDNPQNAGLFVSRNATGAFGLKAEIKNTGNTTLNPFNVQGVVRAANNAIQVSNTIASDTLIAGDVQLLNFVNPFVPTTAGAFRFITTTTLAGDATPSNDGRTLEIQVIDTTTTEIELAWENGVSSTPTGISWSGGDGGCANYFAPPFYPCDITKVKAYIVADANAVGYTMRVYADDGPDGLPGTQLDSVVVAPGSFTIGTFVTSTLSQPIRIDSGGFYVVWDMNGDGVALGQNQIVPFSGRSFEILGGAVAEYRSRDIEDLMIRAVIERIGVGMEENATENAFGNFFPNPANDRSFITVDAAQIKGSTLIAELIDMKGSLVSRQQLPVQNGQVEVNTSALESGIYTVRFVTETVSISRKLSVSK